MAKYSFQDIRPSRRRARGQYVKKTSHREGDHNERGNKNIESSIHNSREMFSSTDTSMNSAKTASRFGIWFVALLSVFVFIMALGGLFSGATINITPRQEKAFIEGTFTSSPSSRNFERSDISHELMTIYDEESAEIPASEEKMVERKASGIIVVYNKHSNAKQRLIKNTRFESTEGKIYRIKESIVVPGTKVVDGEIIPGSIEVRVYADEPGEDYNAGLMDFTIPGFKGDKRFDTFYARSKTEMEGGFSGILKYPSADELEKTLTELKEVLRQRLNTKAYAQKPDDFVMYDDGLFVSFDEISDRFETDGDVVTVTQKARLDAMIFDKNKLTQFVAGVALASFFGDPVKIPNIEELAFTVNNKDAVDVLGDEVSFVLSGDILVVWESDKELLKEKLKGTSKKKSVFESNMKDFVNIESADASIRPFWKRTFPDNVEDIRIKEIIRE